MSSLRVRGALLDRPAPDEVLPDVVRVSWAVGRRALALTRPDLAGNPRDPRPIEIVLEVPGERRAGQGIRVVARDPATGTHHLMTGLDTTGPEITGLDLNAPITWTHDPEARLLHVEAGPLLSLTFTWPGRAVCLYAASSLLRGLGLAGGRYEVEGIDIA